MPKSALDDILGAVTIIVAIFAVIYMLRDIVTGIMLVLLAGALMLLRAFINKHL